MDIRTVAEYYGLQVDRAGKAHCPFHNEKTASFSLHESQPQYYKCFGCGKSGDVISLTADLLGYSNQADALRRLNEDFSLGLELDHKKETVEERVERRRKTAEFKRRKQQQAAFDQWINHAFITVSEYAKLLRLWGIYHRPKPYEPPDEYFMEYCQNISRTEYLCDILIYGSQQDFRDFYIKCREEVKQIELRIDCYKRGD